MHCHQVLADLTEASRFLLNNVPCPPPFIELPEYNEFTASLELTEYERKCINEKCNIGDKEVTYVTRHYTDIKTTIGNITGTTTEPITEPIIVEDAGIQLGVILGLTFALLILVLICYLIISKRQKIMDCWKTFTERSKEKEMTKDVERQNSWKTDSVKRGVKPENYEWDETVKDKLPYMDEGERICLSIDVELSVYKIDAFAETHEKTSFLQHPP